MARTNVHSLRYHFIGPPKYQKTALTDGGADRLESLIEDKADELALESIELANQPDLVHRFISGYPELAPNKIIQQIKGYSSRVLRDAYDYGLLSLWTRSHFVTSPGEVSRQTIEAQTG